MKTLLVFAALLGLSAANEQEDVEKIAFPSSSYLPPSTGYLPPISSNYLPPVTSAGYLPPISNYLPTVPSTGYLPTISTPLPPVLCGCPPYGPPVCGSDWKTYRNECELNCGNHPKAYLIYKGPCEDLYPPGPPYYPYYPPSHTPYWYPPANGGGIVLGSAPALGAPGPQ